MDAIRILLVEDTRLDAELQIAELERGGVQAQTRVVQTERELRRELDEFKPQVVLSDFAMPGFNGFAALRICRERDPDLPFIFISGTIGEDVAVEAMRAGASDYVMKNSLFRLVPAVLRELRDAEDSQRRRLAEAALDRAQSMARLGYVVTGEGGAFESWSGTLPLLIGADAAAMPASTREWLELVHPQDHAVFREVSLRAAITGQRADIGYRLRRPDGAWISVRQAIEPLPGARAEAPRRWINTIQDVSDQVAAEEKVRRLNRVYAVLSAINGLIVRVKNREELFKEACRIAVKEGGFVMAWLGLYDRAASRVTPVAWDGAVGDFFEVAADRLSVRHDADDGPAAAAIAERKPFLANDVAADERILLKKEHAKRGIRSVAMLPLVVGSEAIGVLALHAAEAGFFDDEEMKLLLELAGDIAFAIAHIEKEEKLDYLAYYDSITGLAHRTLFLERLAQSISAASHSQGTLGLVLVDIERFKAINDSLGRQAGDALLRQVAERMTALHAPADLARVGADQFAVIIPDPRSAEDVARLAEERSKKVFGTAYELGAAPLRVGARAGIALYPNDGDDAEKLFRNAESALKRAKATGQRRLFYEQQMSARVAENLSLEMKLRQALEKGEFVLHYQPKVELETRRIVGGEALLRWQSPELGLVPPMQFIPLMEQTGLIMEAGAWALRQAALDQRAWRKQGLDAPRVAVNVSAIQLRQRNFIDVLTQAIQNGAAVGTDLEITESLLVEDLEATMEKLAQARVLGLSIAIDDFGTGHSSLAYLARLPVDSLKIDRSFISRMLNEPNTMTLVQTIISLAHSLGLKVVAEGVETEEQAKVLRLLRCDQMQGYLISKPVQKEQFAALLAPRAA